MLVVMLIAALLPSLLLVRYFHSRDLHPEPARVVWATYGLGVAVLIPEVIVAAPFAWAVHHVHDAVASSFLGALLAAAVPEEAFKQLVVTRYCARHREFDEPMDGIVYGAIAGLGFAALENVMYVASGGLGLALLRAVTAVPNHAFMGAIMGYYVGQAKFVPERRGALLARAYLFPVALHTSFDFPILALKAAGPAQAKSVAGLLLISIATLAFEWVWSLRLVRKLRREQASYAI